ncbi:3'-5' exonuclease, partial [Klebsiella pneumoniae]|uniref:3'-5' exonuclease n=1 Tax=Klebsiella pneumoniae TaxID=573 RepID=UPI0037C0AD7A
MQELIPITLFICIAYAIHAIADARARSKLVAPHVPEEVIRSLAVLEEERRLAYVGITRARQKLVLSYAESRRIHGQDNYSLPSRFLREIPRELLHEVRPKVQVSRPASMGASRVMGHASIEAPPIKLGALVTHPKFGEGMVTDYEGSGAHARVQVEFAD